MWKHTHTHSVGESLSGYSNSTAIGSFWKRREVVMNENTCLGLDSDCLRTSCLCKELLHLCDNTQETTNYWTNGVLLFPKRSPSQRVSYQRLVLHPHLIQSHEVFLVMRLIRRLKVAISLVMFVRQAVKRSVKWFQTGHEVSGWKSPPLTTAASVQVVWYWGWWLHTAGALNRCMYSLLSEHEATGRVGYPAYVQL